ncbi:MAG: L-threonylcarbamoyladenylate synthase [Verrucomicrobiales bacterium]|jgi:L-threonylcarbamoyladenylate synthase
MSTLLVPTDTKDKATDAVTRAVDLLRAGEVVALPTETVYGLGADAFNEAAVAKIFEVKERPKFDPLIVHLPSADDLSRVAIVPEEIESDINRLIQEFWPGPLTLVLPKTDAVPDIVTAGLPTVAVRVSAHPIMRQIVRALGNPIAAPSANRFGRLSPTSAAAVIAELDGLIPLVVNGGACASGLESTIIQVEASGKSKPIFHVLRAGPIIPDQLKPFGKVILRKSTDRPSSEPQDAPGQLASHYAPRTPLRLVENPSDFRPDPNKSYALLSYRGEAKDGYLELVDWAEVAVLTPGSGKQAEAAVRLFYVLRQLDESGVDEIIAEPMSEVGLGIAMMDRLRRASVKGVDGSHKESDNP